MEYPENVVEIMVKKTEITDTTVKINESSEMVPNPFETLFKDSGIEENPQTKIVNELLSDDNLDKKTELDKPLKWSALKVIQMKLEAKKMLNSTAILEEFIDKSFKYQISKKRKSRAEFVEALKAFNVNMNLQSQSTRLLDMMK